MEHKNPMSRVERLHREKVTRYSIRKYSFGAASVAVAALFMFLGNGAVSANELSKQDTPSVEASAPASEDKPTSEEAIAKPVEATTPTLDKSELTNLISEIETKLSNGSYDNKTEESVAVLKADLESAKATLANATTQAELKKAYSKLVTTANTKLKNKPVEKKETPAVDTTNGKETVGKKAENTEKKSESNSIENSGSKDERNGQALDKNNAFRAETTATQGNFTYSMEYSNGKEIYLYNEEDTDIDITVNSTAGDITKATVKSGSGQFLLKSKRDAVKAGTKPQPVEEENEKDGFGWTYRQTLTPTKGPVTIKITGKPNDEFKGLKPYTKTEDQNAVLGARYLQLENSNGDKLAAGSNLNAPGAFNLVVKSQTYKYDIQPVAEGDKVAVADINSLTAPEITKIKEKIKIQYSDTATTQDARLASHRGEVLADRSSVVKDVAVANGTVTVTYKDDSVDTTPVANVARVNAAPTVEIPFSVDGKKDVYVYANEDFELPIKFKDDSGKVASATITRGGNVEQPPKDASNPNILNNEFNTTVEKISTETVATAETPAIVKIKGNISKDNSGIPASSFPKTAEGELKIVTRYATATDTDGAYIKNTATEQAYASDPGSFTIKLKAQTAKYDIKTPASADKVTVSDANNISDEDFEKIKAKVKIEYSNNNIDMRLADKKGTEVENPTERVERIEREGNNVVVTYKDGSKDTKALADFVNVAPKVALPYSNEANKQIYVYTGENTDLTFKGTDEKEIKDLYLRGPGDISGNNAAGYGLPTGKVENGEVTGEGSVSEDKTSATIKMTGKTNLPAGQQWTSFIVSKDNDGKLSNTDYRALDKDPNARQKPGYAHFLVKNQTFKYDIATPTEKVAVTDPANVTQDELDKIKEKLQIEYSKNNDDANLAEKKGKAVDAEDAKTKIKSVEKDNAGNLVVTYTDGSKDTRSLSEFVTLDKQPAIEAVEKAAEAKIDEINKTPNATDDEKQAAIDKVNADKKKALDEIAKPEVTTKEALDTAKTAGTTAIVGDNPVVAKKDAAKADVETARKAKEDAIKANPNLTQAEKDAAIAKNNTAAEEATKAIDSATTNDAVDKAKEAGTGEIAKVNPVAKEAAKKAVADELAEKEKAIDARTDLTDEEKAAAKKDAKAKAKAATDAINAQPDNAETPEAATTAQTAVNNAKDKGVADVKAVNPVAKEAAKKAVADELAEKEKAIDARTDLTDAEKTAAKDDAKAKAKAATDVIDAQPSNAATPEEAATAQTAVNGAKDKGVADVKAVNPVAKAAAKKAIADELAKKEKAIDGRTDLTDEEKAAAKKDAQDKAKEATDAIDAQPSNAATPEEAEKAQTAVNGAKDKGVADVKAVDPAAAKKPEAKKAVDDALKAKVDAIDAREDLTPAEKQEAKDKAAEEAKKAKEAIDAATTDAAVDTAKTAGTGEIAKVNPVAKTKAKEEIAKELAKKEEAIDGRTDLTDAEKAKAKEDAKAKAKEATDAINAQPDNAATPEKATEAQTAVNDAKDKGVADVKAVNPVAKEAAKKAVADELAEKEKAIDGRTDLTDEEKAAAKKDAQDKAKEATDAIDAQPSNAATPEEAEKAQTAVNNAKDKGVADVKAVDPAAAKKPEAKQAIDDALKAKEAAIDARTDLTDDEKKAAKDAAKDAADKAKEAIDAAPSNAEVDKAKEAGTGEIAKVNPVAKEAAKKAVADELKAKEAEIAGRNDLTDEEKAKAKEEAQAKAKEATDAIDAQPSNAETPEKAAEAQTAVDGAKDKGVADVKAVDPEAKAKPVAKKAIEDKLAKQLEDIANTPDATDDEKKVAADAAKALAEGAKKEIDKAGTDAEVKQLQEEAEGEIEKSVPVVEDKPNARKAIEDEAKAKKEAIDARTDLTPKAKEDLKAQVDAIADQAKKSVDAAKTSEAVDGIEESDKAAIKAVGEVNIPADKVLVNNPSALTDDEKAKVLEAVKKVNPDAKEITQDADGNVTVTTPDGHKEIITPEQVVKTAATANDPKAGNDIVKPADKVVVNDPAKLTDAEKEKIKAAVEAVNPNSIVVVDDKGNAKVSTPDGQTQVIPVEELVRTVEDTKKPNAGNDIVKPADKTVVANPEKLTDTEKKAIEDKVKAVNPDATVVVDDKGNTTVTTPEGKTAVIPAADLTKDPETATKPNAGNDIVKPADKTAVKDPANLTPEEKKAIEDKVKAVNPGATVVVDDKGNTTVTTPEGKTAVIPAADLTKDPETATKPNAGNDIVKPADKTAVKDPANLTPEEKKAIEDKVKAVNPGATVVVDDKGNATVTTPEGKTAVIPAADLTKDPETATKPNAGNDIVKPADKTAVKDPANLTPEEKKAIEDKVKAVNPGATVVVDDKGNATVTTPEGKTAVIPATDLTKSPADAAKANAGNTVNTPAAKVEVKDPAKLTDEEKAKVKEAIEAVNPGSKVVVDDKGNATVTTPEGDVVVIPTTDLTKSPADAGKANAGNAVNTPAAKVEVKDPAKLTDEEKAKVKKAVEDVNPGSKVVVDDKGNTTVTTSEGKTATIPAADVTKSAADAGKANAGNAVNTPAAKVEVKDPANLTDAEKKAIEDKVKAVNPGSKVVVDDKGNVTVTTPEGKTATIPAADVTKSAADAGKANAGNGANTPATKTVVKDPAKLTDEEKAKVKKAVEDVNPGSTVVVNDKGDVIVTKGDGTVLVIPELDLVIPEDKLTDPTQQNGVNTPATRVLVGDKAKLTADEIEKVKESIKAVNPGSTVVVDDKGNATVTTPEGKTATIPAAQLVKDAKDVAAKNNGENINVDFEKETVADFNNLTDAEKEAAKAKIKGANADVVEVIFDKAGNATVITKDGKVYTIVAKDIFKQRPYVPSNGGGNNSGNGNGTSGNNGATNTDAKVDKAKLEGAIRQLDELIVKESAKLDAETAKEANALLADAKKVFANADASQAEVDAMVKRIEGFMAKVASSTDHATPANDQAAQTPAVDTATTQAASAQANARKVAKELPNTGTADSTVAMVAAAASALLGLGLAGRRRKEDEEA